MSVKPLCSLCNDTYYRLMGERLREFAPCPKCNPSELIPMINLGDHLCFHCQQKVHEGIMFFLDVPAEHHHRNYRITFCPPCFREKGLEYALEQRDAYSQILTEDLGREADMVVHLNEKERGLPR